MTNISYHSSDPIHVTIAFIKYGTNLNVTAKANGSSYVTELSIRVTNDLEWTLVTPFVVHFARAMISL